MQMRIFTGDQSAEAGRLQSDVNEFLSSLPKDAVKHAATATAVSRSALTDKPREHYVITVWFEV
jgi:hypothetical protein